LFLLISSLIEPSDHIEFVGKLASVVKGESVRIDVTHGYRHLPMVAIVVARYLEKVSDVHVLDLHYGALDMQAENGVVPVISLQGLLDMLSWIDAVSLYESTGRYGQLADLFGQSGLSASGVHALGKSAYFESVTNVAKARESLTSAVHALEQSDLSPLGSLFKNELLTRVDWRKAENHGERELLLAEQHLGRGDYLRAAALAREGAVMRELALTGGSADDKGDRESAAESVRERGGKDVIDTLFKVRNAMAHGERSTQPSVATLMNDEDALRQAIRDGIKEIRRLRRS
jgi:CRISPR-associated DxTHG motif protein